MTALIRPLNDTDLDHLEAIERRCFSTPWSRNQLSESVRHHAHLGLTLSHPSPIIGYAFFMQILDEAHLLNLVIDLPWQRQGLGRFLLEAVLNHLRATAAQSILLEVRASNLGARQLYAHAGFTVLSLRKGYYSTPDRTIREDALVMRLALCPTDSATTAV